MFKELISRIAIEFQTSKVPYMIIGGQAVLLYGEPRLTRDIDITLGLTPDKLSEILIIVKKLSLRILPENIEKFVRETMVLPCLQEKTGIRVDFIFSFTPYERKAIERARKIKMGKAQVSFASPEDVIIHKIFANRPRDIEDVKSILIRNESLDFIYITEWLKEFDKSNPGEDYLAIFNNLLPSDL